MINDIKKHITSEWLKAYPGLTAYEQNKLYKIVGPFICGIELINLPRSAKYRPHFVIYPLFKNDIKSCLEFPTLLLEFYNDRGLQLNLPYSDPQKLYKEAQNIVSRRLPISFNQEVNSCQLYQLIDRVLLNEMSYKAACNRASLLEIKLYTASYVKDKIQVANVWREIQNESTHWNMQNFELCHGQFDLWLENLQENLTNWNKFLQLVENNKQDKKIAKLHRAELIS